ncbi:MAG: DUF5069 domain-containing protein [Opitutaceae bacterium]
MPAIEGLRSPYDKSAGGLHHLGRMLDKIRLQQNGRLPADFQRNYGLSIGGDGQLCGFLGVEFAAVEARVKEGGTDAEIAEWIFARGLRPNRTQTFVWNEHSRKLGWNDRVTTYLTNLKKETGAEGSGAVTSFDMIEYLEGRPVPPVRGG